MTNNEFLEYLEIAGIYKIYNKETYELINKSSIGIYKLYKELSKICDNVKWIMCIIQLLCVYDIENEAIVKIIDYLNTIGDMFILNDIEWNAEIRRIMIKIFGKKDEKIESVLEQELSKIYKASLFRSTSGEEYKICRDGRTYKLKVNK